MNGFQQSVEFSDFLRILCGKVFPLTNIRIHVVELRRSVIAGFDPLVAKKLGSVMWWYVDPVALPKDGLGANTLGDEIIPPNRDKKFTGRGPGTE